MATPNPLEKTHAQRPPPVSKETHVIGGILCTVFGLQELLPESGDVACLWLLNPRLQTQACMEPVAFSAISHWNKRLKEKNELRPSLGLIAVSFDQRNHGSRMVDPVANEAWAAGNEKHAQDMFSIFHGTSLDTSQLITYLPSYIFPRSERTLSANMVLGISLGGHAAWHCILHDPRITTAVVIIGCPDYTRLMSDRARLSKRKAWKESSPPGSDFIGSVDFPQGLKEAVETYDPAGLCLGDVSRADDFFAGDPSPAEQARLLPILKQSLQGKRILNLAGGADKLVPYKQGEPFYKWFKKAISPHGWLSEINVTFEDFVFEGAGHETTPDMLEEAVRFIDESLESASVRLKEVAAKI